MCWKYLQIAFGRKAAAGQGAHLNVTSAGIGALVGKPADETAREVAGINNVSLEGHSARQATTEILSEADLILVMETGHKAAVTQIAPQVSGKVMLADHWAGGQDVADPYKRSREFHEHVFKQLDAAMTGWASRLV